MAIQSMAGLHGHAVAQPPETAPFLAELVRGAGPSITAIAAISRNRALGLAAGLPWDLPEDVAFFETMVAGAALLVGRKTYHTMPLVPPHVFVVASDPAIELAPGAQRVASVEAGLAAALATGLMVFVIGGAGIYEAAWPYCGHLVLTEIDDEFPGDAFFPASIDAGRLPLRVSTHTILQERRSGRQIACRFSCFMNDRPSLLTI